MADVTSWSVAVDLNSDGDFADTNEDLSSFVMTAQWQLGFSKPYDVIARDSTATITLRNNTNKFSPEHASSIGLTRGQKVRIQSAYASTTRTHYIGWIADIQPDAGAKGDRQCVIRCESFFARARAVEVFVPVQESKTADQALDAIFSNSGVYPPGVPVTAFIVGVLAYLGTGRLSAASEFLSAETGKTTFDYIADRWGDGVSILGAIRDTVGREYGRFYVNREGVCVFTNRHHFLSDTTSDATITPFHELQYLYGDEVVNEMTIKAATRKVGASPESLSRLDRATKIPALATGSNTKDITFRFADLTGGGAKIGGKSLIAPVASTDFAATANEDGTGGDYSASVTTAIKKGAGNSAVVTFTNTASVDVWIQSGAVIRGTAIRDYGVVSTTRRNDTSIAAYGYLPGSYPHSMDDIADAEGVADYIVNSRATARGNVRGITISPRHSATLLTQALTRTIFDRITLTETQTGVSAKDYFIVSEKHSLKNAGKDYRCQWILEPADASRFWLLATTGYGELEQKTWLAPL